MCRVQDFLRSKPAINDSCAFTGHNASASALILRTVFCAVGWVLAWEANAEAQVPSAKDLIDGNAAAIAQVRLIDMTFQRLASRDPTDPSATDDVFSTCRWTADMLADVERFRFHTPRPIHPDYPPNRQGKFEVERRGTTFRCLFTSDWEKREQLTPFRQRGIQAFIDPTYGQQDLYSKFRGDDHLMWRCWLGGHLSQVASLKELSELGKGITVDGAVELLGRSAWKLVIHDLSAASKKYFERTNDDPKNIKTAIELTIDQRTFQILRCTRRYEGFLHKTKDGEVRTTMDEWASAIHEFKELSDGILLPMRTESTRTLNGKIIVRTATKTLNAKINEPLDADALEFKFPEYALVEHRPAVNGKTKVELWGANDRPLKEIKDEVEDLKEYLHLAPRFADSPASGGRKWFLWLFVGVAVIGGWLAYRRLR